MLNKLALRNAKRSIKDYIIYLITMTAVAAMMFSFNSMIFSPDIMAMCSEAMILGAMLGIATLFIVLIVAWLINYMAKFMLERRSREFATYLLIGLKKKELSTLYMKENLLVGIMSFVLGLGVGIFLQQVLMSIFYSVFNEEYQLRVQINLGCFLMTLGCFFGCYLLALVRNKRVFKKMSIAQLLRMEKENEEIKEGNERAKQLLFFVAVFYILFVYAMMIHGCSLLGTVLLIAGFVVAIYFLYIGFSAFLVCRVKRKSAGIYHRERLFLYRQMSSKLKTMRFTMGTLTLLMVCALLGSSISLMFAKFQSQSVEYTMPFDVLVHSPKASDDFMEEMEVIDQYNELKEVKIYQIYHNGTEEMNTYYASHVATVTSQYVDENGELQLRKGWEDYREYYEHDTYMKLSDYNGLREMLGQKTFTLGQGEYLLQTKERIPKDLGEGIYDVALQVSGETLQLAEVVIDAFSQNGINGADYVIVVPDTYVDTMTPYYSVMAGSLKEEGTAELRDTLIAVHQQKHGVMSEDEYMERYEELEEAGKDADTILGDSWQGDLLGGHGTDEIFVFIADIIVRDVDGSDMKFVATSLAFPLAYIALIFVCVALTILAVQQLSDAGKYRFRYQLLYKLGMRRREVERLIFRQISFYYLVPALVAAAISSVIAIYTGNIFVAYTGAKATGTYYFAVSMLMFFGVYFMYFIATYIGFKRNVITE